jgi:predicted nucleic acid-binding protein
MITSDDVVLLDTNVLVYAADQKSPFHAESRAFRDRGRSGEFIPCVTPQVLFEFYAVITDSRRVTQPLSASEAAAELKRYFGDPQIRKIHPGPEIGDTVLALLGKYEITRQDIFDLLIVATMTANDVRKICTYDDVQFSKFSEIEVVRPTA